MQKHNRRESRCHAFVLFARQLCCPDVFTSLVMCCVKKKSNFSCCLSDRRHRGSPSRGFASRGSPRTASSGGRGRGCVRSDRALEPERLSLSGGAFIRRLCRSGRALTFAFGVLASLPQDTFLKRHFFCCFRRGVILPSDFCCLCFLPASDACRH